MAELYPEDQEKVDEYLRSNVNATERKPFRPGLLLLVIFASLVVLSGIAYWVALGHGVV